uniref:PH domain-containing protein n=1 Tax=Timema poppense TaxID=170557 RepID=A0A7R9GWW3_TIMPO|nr:unnamed protein product [Timema poppensis]
MNERERSHGVSFGVDMTSWQHLGEMSDMRMISSMTSSLSSPVDSGVALLDSDGDGTSVSEATINEMDNTDNLSLRDCKEDDLMYTEIEDNCINHKLLSSGTCQADHKEISSDTTKTTLLNTIGGWSGSLETEESTETSNFSAGSWNDSTGDKNVATKFYDRKVSPLANAVEMSSELQPKMYPSPITHRDLRIENIEETKKHNLEQKAQSCISCIESTTDKTSDTSSSTIGDNIVYRRQRRKKRNGSEVKMKRVSFHGDFILPNNNDAKVPSSDFSVSFLPPNAVIKNNVSKGRYSWCSEGDAPYITQYKNESDTKSDIYLSSSSTLSSNDESKENQKCDRKVISHSSYQIKNKGSVNSILANTIEGSVEKLSDKGLPVDERGIPEGQEDPPKSSSTLNLYPFTEDNRLGTYSSYLNLKKFPSMASSMDHSDLESMFSDVLDYHLSSTMLSDCNTSRGSQPDLQQSKSHYDSRKSFSSLLDARTLAYKTSILNRFMKSLAERRNNTKKIISFVKPTRSLYIKGIKQNSDALKPFIEEVEAELKKMEADSELNHDEHCWPVEEFLESSVFVNKNEALYKVFRVRNSYFLDETCQPLLVLMTDTTLYVTGSKNNDIYYNYHVLPYKELDAIIVGPNAQTVLFASASIKSEVMVATGNRLMTEKLVSHLEVAMRRASQLPAVRQLQLDDMRSLYHWLAKEVTLSEDEVLCHYSLIHLQDRHISPPTTPLGPIKEGYLMFRPAAAAPLQPWEPGFFLLKAGVVYMFNEKKPSIPKRVIPIRGKHCCGCRRIPNAQRPHTFEILIGPRRSFQFAAADEYEASDWLQAFVQSASGVYEMEHVETVPCTLLVTSHRILTCKEQFPSGPMHVLSCAQIRDVLCIGTVSDQHSWCMLTYPIVPTLSAAGSTTHTTGPSKHAHLNKTTNHDILRPHLFNAQQRLPRTKDLQLERRNSLPVPKFRSYSSLDARRTSPSCLCSLVSPPSHPIVPCSVDCVLPYKRVIV